MSTGARAWLHQWATELDDPDEEQRRWEREFAEAGLEAIRLTGLLEAEEVAAWERVIGGQKLPAAPGDASAAAEHLAGLLSELGELTRDEDPERLVPAWRFNGALEALSAAGILDEDEARVWHERRAEKETPWLAPDEITAISGGEGLYAIHIPPRDEDEAREDAARAEVWEEMTRRGDTVDVSCPDAIERHDGMAMVAVVRCTDCTELHFHHVGAAIDLENVGGMGDLMAAVTHLRPPELTDDLGTHYWAVTEFPSGAGGGMGDPEIPQTWTGSWRYQPAAPPGARVFTARRDAASWTL